MAHGQTFYTEFLVSRRSFIKSLAIAMGAAGLDLPENRLFAQASAESDLLPITVAGYKLDRVWDLANGIIKIDRCDTNFEEDVIGEMNTHVLTGPGTREVTEIGLHPFMLAYANYGFREYALLPIFLLRQFRHKSIFIRTDRGINKPEDLRGRRIATPGYSSTSLTWIRGILEEEYGVSPNDVEWVITSKDSSADAAGKVSVQENILPEGVSVTVGPEGQDESDLIESGAVDALFHAAEPRAYLKGHPRVTRLFSDYKTVEREYYSRTGIFPIMHAAAIRRDIVSDNQWLPDAVFNAYSLAKSRSYKRMNQLGWVSDMLPWYGYELEQTRSLMGDNFYSYGIGPNRKTLETLFRYSYQQGLTKRELSVEELFLPGSLGFSESES